MPTLSAKTTLFDFNSPVCSINIRSGKYLFLAWSINTKSKAWLSFGIANSAVEFIKFTLFERPAKSKIFSEISIEF